MSDMRQFSEESLRRIQRDHTRLKALADTLAVQQQQQQREGEIIRTVTGFTSTNSMFPTYPTAAGHNTYVVKLRDYSFTPTTGAQTRSAQGNATRSIIARTWDGSSVTENTPVVCDLVYAIGKGPQWWIRPAAGTPSPNPVYAYQLSSQITATNSYIRGGSWASGTEYFGIEFEKYRGDAAANNVQFLAIGGSNDPFLRILKTGHYMMDWLVGATWTYGQARSQTVASELGGAPPGHFHDVTVPNGRDITGTMLVILRYKLNNTGSATTINDFAMEFPVVASESSAEAADADIGFGRYQICLNLTANWYINARFQWSNFRSTTYHRCSNITKSSMRIQYLGDTVSDVTV